MSVLRVVPLLVVLAIVAGACSSTASTDGAAGEPSSTTSETGETTTTSVEPADGTTTEALTVTAPASEVDPIGQQLDWIVTAVNNCEETTAVLEDHFSSDFLDAVPPSQLLLFFPQLATLAEPPVAIEEVTPDTNPQVPPGVVAASAILIGADDARLEVSIAVADDAPNLIEGLFIAPQMLEFPEPVTVEAIDRRLADLATASSLAVFDVSSGECEAVHEIRADQQLLLGSVFKLWVLEALAHEVDQGNASWDETMAVTDELRLSLIHI